MREPKDFGAALTALLDAARISPDSVVEMLNAPVTRTTLYDWMSGAHLPGDDGPLLAVVDLCLRRAGDRADLRGVPRDARGWLALLAEAKQARDRRRMGAKRGSASGRSSVRGSALPVDTAIFMGRGEQLDRLRAAVEALGGGVLAIHAVDGMAGVGKSTFAIHAAHCLVDKFPDGAVFLPLHAHTPGVSALTAEAALGALLLGDGLSPAELPSEQAARELLWRKRTAGRRMLLVLDDAADAGQVRPLLPSGDRSLVLVTSRRRIGLRDAAPIGIGALDSRDAIELFVASARRPGLDPADPDIVRLVELCGYLPLAIALTAARLLRHRDWSPGDLIEQFQDAENRLQEFAGPDVNRDQDQNVAVAFDRSYEDLSPDRQRLFRLLGRVSRAGLRAGGRRRAAGVHQRRGSQTADGFGRAPPA
jgi:hypothetical protein